MKQAGIRPSEEEAAALWAYQAHISSTRAKTKERNRLLTELNARGVTQKVLAGIISDASQSHEMPSISEDGVQKAIRDYCERFGAPREVAK